LTCGGSHEFATNTGRALFDRYICGGRVADRDTWGPEVIYSFTAPVSGEVVVSVNTGNVGNLAVFVLQGDPAGNCSQYGCLNWGDLTTVFWAIAGQTYYLVVDGDYPGPYRIDTRCRALGQI
jgi:hypothetical protein